MRVLRSRRPSRKLHTGAGFAAGFTLLELLITVAVAAILAAIAIPSFRNVVQNSARDSALNNLSSALNYARNAALRTDSTVSVCAKASSADSCGGADWNKGWIVATKPPSASTVVLMSKPALDAAGPQITSDLATVQFLPNGLVTNQANFTICDNRGNAAAKALEVYATGYVQVSAEAGQTASGGSTTCP